MLKHQPLLDANDIFFSKDNICGGSEWYFNIRKDKVLISQRLKIHGYDGVLASHFLKPRHDLKSQEARHTVICLCSPASHSCSTICSCTTSIDSQPSLQAKELPISQRKTLQGEQSHLRENGANSTS